MQINYHVGIAAKKQKQVESNATLEIYRMKGAIFNNLVNFYSVHKEF